MSLLLLLSDFAHASGGSGGEGGLTGLYTVAYLGAGILFILSLGGLSSQESASRGNMYGILGMIIALVATMLHEKIGLFSADTAQMTEAIKNIAYTGQSYGALAFAIGGGAAIGAILAARVQMTAMPELVAALEVGELERDVGASGEVWRQREKTAEPCPEKKNGVVQVRMERCS